MLKQICLIGWIGCLALASGCGDSSSPQGTKAVSQEKSTSAEKGPELSDEKSQKDEPTKDAPKKETLAIPPEPTRYTLDQLDGRDGRPLVMNRFRPRVMLKTEKHFLTKAKYPVVDVHTHPAKRNRSEPDVTFLDNYIKIMGQNNIAISVSLDGGLGDQLDEHKQYLWTRHKDQFVIFATLDFLGEGEQDDFATWACNQPGFVRNVVLQLEDAHNQGTISGLKFYKQFGLGYRGADGKLLLVDDPRWDPIWEACGKLGLVVIMHVADPAAFFDPIDEMNERHDELSRHPNWSFHGKDFPTRKELLDARNRVIAKHPKTQFIGAHVANNPEDLKVVGEWLDKYPNLSVEIAARIAELGRQPYSARKFFIRYADRILFGTDGPRDARRLAIHWRFLETRDEYIRYSEYDFPPQGFWRIHGLGLPDDVLRKVYFENAARLIPGVLERLEVFLKE